MRRSGLGVAVAGAILLAGGVAYRHLGSPGRPAGGGPGTKEPLDSARWLRISEGDFEECGVDAGGDGRLRIHAATRGTRDETVKFLGVRSVKRTALEAGSKVVARLDWNRQANGSYLSGAIILSPEVTSGNPLVGPDWFKVEYIGVPPGRNARLFIASKSAGRERSLFAEGWPEQNREGRPIALQTVEIVAVSGGGVQVLENGTPVFETKEKVLPSAGAHVYLQMSTHSNYPPREIFFDRIAFPGGP